MKAMGQLIIRADNLDIELIQEAIRERIRARALSGIPVAETDVAGVEQRRIEPLADWNLPHATWRAMWPPNLEPWNLDEDFVIHSHRPGIGTVLVPVKRALRAVLRVLLRPLLSQQVEINRTLALICRTLAHENAEQHLHLKAVEGRIARMAAAMREARGEEPPVLRIDEPPQ